MPQNIQKSKGRELLIALDMNSRQTFLSRNRLATEWAPCTFNHRFTFFSSPVFLIVNTAVFDTNNRNNQQTNTMLFSVVPFPIRNKLKKRRENEKTKSSAAAPATHAHIAFLVSDIRVYIVDVLANYGKSCASVFNSLPIRLLSIQK